MKLTIEYCATCNYLPIAAAIARQIEQETGIRAELIHSHKPGSFLITFKETELFSKIRNNRFPDANEIISMIKNLE